MILSTHLFCLLNLSTIPQFPSLLLAYTFDILDHIRQHNQLNIIRYSLCTMHYALYTLYYSVFTIHYALCIMHYALCTMHYALYTMHYLLCTIHYALFTMHYALCTMHYALCIMHYVFIRIHTYLLFYTYSYVLLFHMDIRRNPLILVLTRSSLRVE